MNFAAQLTTSTWSCQLRWGETSVARRSSIEAGAPKSPTPLREVLRRAHSGGPGRGSGGRPSPKIPRVWNATTCARLLRFLAAYVASVLPKGNSNPAQPHPDAIRPCPSWGACYRELRRIPLLRRS